MTTRSIWEIANKEKKQNDDIDKIEDTDDKNDNNSCKSSNTLNTEDKNYIDLLLNEDNSQTYIENTDNEDDEDSENEDDEDSSDEHTENDDETEKLSQMSNIANKSLNSLKDIKQLSNLDVNKLNSDNISKTSNLSKKSLFSMENKRLFGKERSKQEFDEKIKTIESNFKETVNLIADGLGYLGLNNINEVPFVQFLTNRIKYLKEWGTLIPWKDYLGDDASRLNSEKLSKVKKMIINLPWDLLLLNKQEKFTELIKLSNSFIKGKLSRSDLKTKVIETLDNTFNSKNIDIALRLFNLLSAYE